MGGKEKERKKKKGEREKKKRIKNDLAQSLSRASARLAQRSLCARSRRCDSTCATTLPVSSAASSVAAASRSAMSLLPGASKSARWKDLAAAIHSPKHASAHPSR